MKRLGAALAGVLRRGASEPTAGARGDAGEAVSAFRRQVADLREQLRGLHAHLAQAQRRTERLLAEEREQVHDRAALAALPRARLLCTSMTLEGSPSERLRVRRVRVGDPVERPFSRWLGITRCVTASADVRELWERLLAFEAECGDDVLRGLPCTILDVPGAAVSIVDGTLRVATRQTLPPDAPVVGVPRCTYDFAPRKVANFGHWLLDCAPQIVALWKVAPHATFLLPHPQRWFHTATLALMGLDVRQMVPWDGSPVGCSRLLAFESDGRIGGGRPLSLLMEARHLLAPTDAFPAADRNRRIYVSRRDAPKKRKWIVNEPEVEELFRSRGFEIIVMRDCPLDEQVRLFRQARVVAGLNGGGLTDIAFSASGTHVIVLLSDTLIRWYAGGGRSVWTGGGRGGAGRLSALGDSPRFWTHVAAAFEQRCHSFVGGDEMPLGELGRYLDDVLAEVERT